jgi:acyl-CoA synthetase (AMP-forming)/AMP-acid ligase II
MRLIDYFDRGADLYPDRHCLHDGMQGWTYRDVRAQTHRVANGLLAAGLGRGSKAAGKVLKKTLREPYWAGRERKI